MQDSFDSLADWQALVDLYLLPLALALAIVTVVVSLRYRRSDASPMSAAAIRRNWLLVFVAVVAFALLWVLGYVVAAGRAGYGLDVAIAAWARDHISSPALVFLSHLTEAGSTVWLTIVGVSMSVWQSLRGRPAVGFACIAAGAANGLTIRALKAEFARVRPEHLQAIVSESSYSYPSGHAAGSILVYGLLAWLVTRDLPPRRRLPAFCLALVAVVAIATTRVLLQVHYLTDVIGGMLLGLSMLALAVVWIRSRERRGAGQLATEVNA